MSRRRRIWLSLAAVAVVLAAGGLYWFQPWKLFVDHRVDEALPAVATQPVDVDQTLPPSGPPAATSPSGTAPARPAARLLSRGKLVSHEHDTSGTVSVVLQPDGSRVLAIADLDTSDGPDVRIWLSDQPVRHGDAGWYVFGKGHHVDLGGLKGNLGNQVYPIPASADLSRLTSVTIWCQRFDVSFGAAALRPL